MAAVLVNGPLAFIISALCAVVIALLCAYFMAAPSDAECGARGPVSAFFLALGLSLATAAAIMAVFPCCVLRPVMPPLHAASETRHDVTLGTHALRITTSLPDNLGITSANGEYTISIKNVSATDSAAAHFNPLNDNGQLYLYLSNSDAPPTTPLNMCDSMDEVNCAMPLFALPPLDGAAVSASFLFKPPESEDTRIDVLLVNGTTVESAPLTTISTQSVE